MLTRISCPVRGHQGLVLLVMTVVTACGTEPPTGSGEPPTEAVASVEVAAAVDTLVAAGETSPLQVTLRDRSGNSLTGRAVTWQSSNDAVASVAGDAGGGTLNALAAGTVVVTAESEGQRATIEMRVLDADLATVQALLEDGYTAALLGALSGANAAELGAAMTDMSDDLTSRFLSGVRDALGDASALIVIDPSEEDAVVHAVLRLVLDHVEALLKF